MDSTCANDIKSSIDLIQKMNKYIEFLTILYLSVLGGVCPSHNKQHGICVMSHASNALQFYDISEHEKKLVLIAALLHDADDHKLFSQDPDLCINTRCIMTACGHNEEDIHIVMRMINLVSASKNKDTIPDDVPEWYLVPRYADRLEAIGRAGIERTIQYNRTHNMPIYVSTTPLLTVKKDIIEYISNNKIRYQNYTISDSLIDHFYDKLFHITQFPIRNPYFDQICANALNQMVEFVITESQKILEIGQS